MQRKGFSCFAYCVSLVLLVLLTVGVTACSTSKTTTTFTGAPVLNSIAVTPNPPPSLSKGHTLQFKAVGSYSDGTTADITSRVTWTSDNTSAAAIDNSGLATGVEAGIANVTAALDGITSPAQILVVVSYY
jgi:hypothetical protein